MKRIFISVFLAAFVTFVAKAESVTKSEAYSKAQQYMFDKGKIISQSKTPFRSVRKVNGQPESAYYYVFNADGGNGYVIVSGDDRTPEILGYVDEGSFDPNNIPENMKSWLQLYEDQIKFIVDNNITVNRNAVRARAKAQATRRSVPELLTTRWNQGEPYNITCPDYYLEDDTKEQTPFPRRSRPATGCTATAMAQVMNFYRFPAATKSVIPGYSITYTSKTNGSQATVSQQAIPKNTPIDWDNMQDRYSWENGHVANVHDSAVANLMHMCGQAVNMHYGPSSGANFSAEAYIKYFGFDNSCYVGERGDYSIDDWFDMIYNEISQGYPVLFSGFSSGGGHAFVLDGYDGDNLFHVNWGWGGGSNGWFLVGILNPGDNSGIGASSSSDGYSMSQRALFNLRLPDDNKYDTYLDIKDVAVSGTSILSTFVNKTGATGSFNIGIVRIAEDGTLALVGNSQSLLNMSNNTTSPQKSFIIKGKLPEGTYHLSPASKSNRSSEWRPKYNMRTQYVEAVVGADGSVTLTPYNISAGSSISIDTITFPGTRIVGKEQEVKVTYRNNGNEYFKEVRMFASQTNEKIYTDSRSIVAVRKDDKVDVSYFFEPKETGTYNLWFCTGSNGSGEVGHGTIEIISDAEAEKSNLSVSSYIISNLVSNNLYGHNLVGKATIRNNDSKEYVGWIKLQLWNQPNGSGSAYGGTSHSYEVNILPGKSAVVDFEFDGLSENNKYYLAASFVNHTGTFSNSGVWDLGGWVANAGLDQWKNDGSLTGRAYAQTTSTATNICGVYVDCPRNISRLSPNSRNPNVVYAFSANMAMPERLDTSNVVRGVHADKIRIVNGYPYFVPTNFKADTATFVYTFPADLEKEVAWQSVTMPFDVDSIVRGEFTYQLNDTLNHFWIYEFAETDDNGNPVFKPATVLHGGTPYLIACDGIFKGKTIEFKGYNKSFFKSGLGKKVVSGNTYSQYGYTFQPKLKDVYALNESGSAFEYVTTNTTLPAMGSYFTTKLAAEEKLEQILLPAVPFSSSKSAGWGDVNQDRQIDASDVQALALVLVLKAPEGSGVEYGDANGDGKITIADLVTLINQVKE